MKEEYDVLYVAYLGHRIGCDGLVLRCALLAASYVPIRTPARKLLMTPTPGMTPGYLMPEEDRGQSFDIPMGHQLEGLPEMKPEDMQVNLPPSPPSPM